MKRCILMLALIFGFQMTMMAQKSKPKQTSPKEDIKVNREFDEKGNLIKFDSLYSYSWSGDTLLSDSIHPKDFPDFFGNNFNFPSDSSFFDFPSFEGFDQHFFELFNPQQDSLLQQFGLHNQFNFKNDSIDSNSLNIEDFLKQFSENKNDSTSSNSPSKGQFNFSAKSMNEMMEMMKKQMKAMEEQQQKFFNK